jgi:hypothetical protein
MGYLCVEDTEQVFWSCAERDSTLRAQDTVRTAHKVGRTLCRLFLYYFVCLSNSFGFRGPHTFGIFELSCVSPQHGGPGRDLLLRGTTITKKMYI